MAKSNITWECTECTQNKRRSIVREISSDDEDNPDEDERITIGDIMREMRSNHERVTMDMQIFRREVTQTLQFLSDSFEELKQENKLIKEKLEGEQKKLNIANARIKVLEERMDEIEQASRNRNIILTNVPTQESENTNELVRKIVQTVHVDLSGEEFVSARISRKPNAPILVKLKTEDTRRKILEKRKTYGTLRMNDCGFQQENIVYFNEDLPRYKQELYAKARNFKKEHQYAYVWVKDGKIFIRKTEAARPLHIRSEKDLEHLDQ
ncbi:uncharacterized protein LOC123315900 [Coccinella septempunctata]|uniref:uncharacterized protein LOC123315900 n=1 Tax=Coccinella septempunctata TaxID=41139 RepID=UPI001D089D82|nr:uncharacterized protein LOC123315900 [Coccinella septempunctata]